MNQWLERRRKLSVYEVNDGERHWYVARSLLLALEMHVMALLPYDAQKRYLSGALLPSDYNFFPCPLNEMVIEKLPPDQVLSIWSEDTGTLERKTCKEWCKLGVGQIASTCY